MLFNRQVSIILLSALLSGDRRRFEKFRRNVMKGWVVLLLVVIGAGTVAACGNAELSTSPGGDDVPRIGISLLAAECPDYLGAGGIADGSKVGSLAIQFYDSTGKLVQVGGKNAVSFTSAQLSEGSVKVTGIPEMINARVVFSAFEPGNTSTPKWRGEVRGVTFTKGKETRVTTVLYPLSGIGCFPNPLIKPRFGHAAALLPDGRILITGGFTERQNAVWVATDDVELLDPETGTVDSLAGMGNLRAFHHMTVLPDGRVLIAGGVRQLEATKMSIDGYPDVPVKLSIPANGIEIYTVALPKVNQRTSTDTDKSTSLFLNTEGEQYFTYQSYAYVMTNPQTGSGTLFMVGGVKDGVAQSKIYGAEIAVSDAEVVATLNEYHADKSETFVWPVVAPAGVDEFGNPRILVVGGKKATTSEKFAHLITKDAYTEWGHDIPNLFLSSLAVEPATGAILIAGGLSLPKDEADFSLNGNAYLLDLSLMAQKSGPLYWGTWLEEAMVNIADGYFTVFGGRSSLDMSGASLEATPFFEHVSTDTMTFVATKPDNPDVLYYGNMKKGRALHRIITTTSGTPFVYITGGIQDIKGAATSLVGIIELIPVTNPFTQ